MEVYTKLNKFCYIYQIINVPGKMDFLFQFSHEYTVCKLGSREPKQNFKNNIIIFNVVSEYIFSICLYEHVFIIFKEKR